ncbi:anthranilate synthase component I [Clostridium tertium]
MVNISKEEFLKNKSENLTFSVISEYRGDEVTPIKIFNSLKGSNKFIFESGEKRNLEGRYSFISENSYLEIQGNDSDTIDKINNELNRNFNVESNQLPFKGGGIGYIGYNAVAFYEKTIKIDNEDKLNVPVVRFNFYKRYVAYDHFSSKLYIVNNIFQEDDKSYEEVLDSQNKYYKEFITSEVVIVEESNNCKKNNKDSCKHDNYKDKYEDIISQDNEEKNVFKYSDSDENFFSIVEEAKEHIKSGDIFQVVLSRRGIIRTEKSALEIYRSLREENPSPYMFLLDYKDYQVVGASPESLVSIKDGIITTNPIAGTRKRGHDVEEDLRLEEELKNDSKELAEHVMLVDLSRNDVGRVSEIGTVEVSSFMKIEKFSHVMHITSTVQGKLKDKNNQLKALFSCFPAGTVSGAPKIRAMQIINELEDLDRGIYSGAIGYASYGGNLEMCIAIRTIVLKDKIANIQAGAGIVYDSIAEKECEEVDNKLSILREVVLR